MTFIKVKNGKPGYPMPGRFLPMLDEVLTDVLGSGSLASAFTKGAAVNIKEDEKNYFLEFAAPGYEKEEFKIDLENQVLTVSAEKKSESKEEGVSYTRREFTCASFQRSFNLPESVNEEGIKAEYKNGILNVSIPKKEEATKSKKEITVE